MSPRRLRLAIASAVGVNFVLAILTLTPTRAGEFASRVSPLVRLPPDLRAGVDAWRQSPEGTLLDEPGAWEDVAIAYHAGKDRDASRREARTHGVQRVIAIRGGRYERTLRATATLNGQPFHLSGELGRISWWDATHRSNAAMDE